MKKSINTLLKPFRAPDWYIILCLNETFSVILPQSFIHTSVVIEFSVLLPPQSSLHPGGDYNSTLIALLSCSLVLLLPLSTNTPMKQEHREASATQNALHLFSSDNCIYGCFYEKLPCTYGVRFDKVLRVPTPQESPQKRKSKD